MIELNAATKWRGWGAHGWGACTWLAWAQEAVRMTQRLRSRTPPASRRGNSHGGKECSICLVEITGSAEPWTCLQCSFVAHVRCMPTRNGHIHLSNGCPGCRVSMTQLVAEAERPRTAAKGIVCYVCKYNIEEGTPCRTCPAPRHYCQAHWHTDCTLHYDRPLSAVRSCPGCSLTSYQALKVRRS
jgi:hypothetical protein